MADRLALAVLLPGVGWRTEETQVIAQEASAAGFDAIIAAEVTNDDRANAPLLGAATTGIQMGIRIANISLRHSYRCARGESSSMRRD